MSWAERPAFARHWMLRDFWPLALVRLFYLLEVGLHFLKAHCLISVGSVVFIVMHPRQMRHCQTGWQHVPASAWDTLSSSWWRGSWDVPSYVQSLLHKHICAECGWVRALLSLHQSGSLVFSMQQHWFGHKSKGREVTHLDILMTTGLKIWLLHRQEQLTHQSLASDPQPSIWASCHHPNMSVLLTWGTTSRSWWSFITPESQHDSSEDSREPALIPCWFKELSNLMPICSTTWLYQMTRWNKM